MKYFIYVVSFLHSISSFSQAEKNIIDNVEAGTTDIQNASLLIEANNTIKDKATAVYKAGKVIILNNGFFADAGSDVFMAIEENAGNNLSQKEITSLDEFNLLGNRFSVYPNPTNGLFTVQGNHKFTSYTIQNILGAQIMFNEAYENDLIIDISKFTAGVYFLELLTEGGEIIKRKIIKH